MFTRSQSTSKDSKFAIHAGLRQTLATWNMESTWTTGKRFCKSTLDARVIANTLSRNSKCCRWGSRAYQHRETCGKRGRKNRKHNSNADICKKAADHELRYSCGYSTDFNGWAAKTANIGTSIPQIPYPFKIFMCVSPKNIHSSSSSRNVVHLAEPDTTHGHPLPHLFLNQSSSELNNPAKINGHSRVAPWRNYHPLQVMSPTELDEDRDYRHFTGNGQFT